MVRTPSSTYVRKLIHDNSVGDIVSITAFGQRIVILNTHKATADLLDKRAANYSDRPRNVVASEILGGGMVLPLLDQTPRSTLVSC